MSNNYELGIKTSMVTLLINIVLTVFKIIAGIVGRSNAMVADGIHTLSDVLSTVVVMVGLKVASKDADESHPYGHEKFELIFSKILSLFLIVTGAFIGYKGVISLINNDVSVPGKIAVYAAIFSIISKEVMYRYTMRVAKEIRSVSMEADAWHHRSDALSSIGTFVGVFGARLGYPILDPLAGILVSFMVIKVGVDLYLKSVKGLVDESTDQKTIDFIKELTDSVEGVIRISDLKTRTFANKIYVDLDIEVDSCITVYEGHEIAQKVHDKIEGELADVKHCMVHVEPCDKVNKCK